MIPTYFSCKIFEILRDKFYPTILKYRNPEETWKTDYKIDANFYKHIFLAPESLSKSRSFHIQGAVSPFICLWATSPLKWNKDLYGRSVLPRDVTYVDKDGNTKLTKAALYDFERQYEIYCSSFYATARDQFNIDLLELDRVRSFPVDLGELIPGQKGTIKFELVDIASKDNDYGENKTRSFDLVAKYLMKISCFTRASLIESSDVEVYVNDNKIFSSLTDTVINP